MEAKMGKGVYIHAAGAVSPGKATGRAIRTARAWAGLTQQELAQRVGVRQETLSAWETGQREPQGVKRWGKLAEECGVPIPRFLAWIQGEL